MDGVCMAPVTAQVMMTLLDRDMELLDSWSCWQRLAHADEATVNRRAHLEPAFNRRSSLRCQTSKVRRHYARPPRNQATRLLNSLGLSIQRKWFAWSRMCICASGIFLKSSTPPSTPLFDCLPQTTS